MNKKIAILSVIFVLFASFHYTMLYTGLASDEEMIAHFKEHRAEFEELVKRYREFDPEIAESEFIVKKQENGEYEKIPYRSHNLWRNQENTLELIQKTGIYTLYVHSKNPAIDDSITLWLPNPYSEETAKLAKEMINSSKKIHDDFSEKKPVEYQYGAIVINLKPKVKYQRNTRVFDELYKDLYFIPEIPRIEDGKLLDPVDINTNHTAKRSVLPSLDRIPIKWHISKKYTDFYDILEYVKPFRRYIYKRLDFSCVFRQIEPQWFLRMCATKCNDRGNCATSW
ncbi:MAG: hypothetical protein LBC08_01770 [Campylobacteraceae bacterium]|nr:hypothetical protein [Campylobacteraceae bacterium]